MDIQEKIKIINKLIKEINEENIQVKAIGKYIVLDDIIFVEESTKKII